MASRAKSIHPGARSPLALLPFQRERERDGARVHRNKSLDGGAFHIFTTPAATRVSLFATAHIPRGDSTREKLDA